MYCLVLYVLSCTAPEGFHLSKSATLFFSFSLVSSHQFEGIFYQSLGFIIVGHSSYCYNFSSHEGVGCFGQFSIRFSASSYVDGSARVNFAPIGYTRNNNNVLLLLLMRL